ncbi:C-C chemokine receptor type 5 isoform X3 [Hydra vulgaris]|uniref:C-C chemokine receptor type 5 isoform X3 n=1 Tax=Hydra vulgaris TaxID=6087 RepID=A0ABM4BI01_HYDVU
MFFRLFLFTIKITNIYLSEMNWTSSNNWSEMNSTLVKLFVDSSANSSLTQNDVNHTAHFNITEENYFSGMTLDQVCQLFEVNSENCSCSNPSFDFFCNDQSEQGEITFTCDTVSNKVTGISNLISSVFALIGNGFVVGFGICSWKDLSIFRQLILGLAISDLIFAIIEFILSIPRIWTCHWLYGLLMCKVLSAVLAASANIAVGFIVIVAVDRYIGIVHIFSKTLNQTLLRVIVIINVVAGILSVLPPLLVLQVTNFETCEENWSSRKSSVYTMVLFFVYYLIPVIALIVLYCIIIAWLKKAYLKCKALNNAQKISRLKKNKRTLVMLISILACFTVLVLPNRAVWIIKDFYSLSNINDNNLFRFLKIILEISYGLHAAVNPIIYSVVDPRFQFQMKSFFNFLSKYPKHEDPKPSSDLRSTTHHIDEVTVASTI